MPSRSSLATCAPSLGLGVWRGSPGLLRRGHNRGWYPVLVSGMGEDRSIREVLFLLLEKVRATKAALHLLEPDGSFRLAASYGFSRADHLPPVIHRGDPIHTHVFEHREPYYINDVRQAGKLAGLMAAASSTRVLTAPLYLDGRVVGILDVRDKANREPFVPDDVAWVQEVLRLLVVPVRALPKFGAPVLEEPEIAIFDQTGSFDRSGSMAGRDVYAYEHANLAPRSASSSASPPLPPTTPELPLDHLPSTTDRARRLVDERLSLGGGRPPVGRSAAALRDLAASALGLEALLGLPGVEAVVLSALEPEELTVRAVSARPLGAGAEEALVENLGRIFARSGARFPQPPLRAVTPVVRDAEAAPLDRADIATIQSSLLSAEVDEVLILSLVYRAGAPAARESMKAVHVLVKSALSQARAGLSYRDGYRGLVNKLLEPGLKRYPALKAHSFAVGRMSRKLATFLQLGAREVEQVTVAGILHDVGMRELNYEELYGKRSLTDAELSLVREHPRVGAFLADEVPWPYAVAPLIRHHHERWDGSGYPDGLSGERIPLGSRLIHVCEAFDAMTSPTSYRSVLAPAQALEILVSKSGTQFDPEMADALKRMLEAGAASR